MSSSPIATDDGEWQVARGKARKGGRQRAYRHPRWGTTHSVISSLGDVDVSGDVVLNRVNGLIPRMTSSGWYTRTVQILRSVLRERRVDSVVCLGLGSPTLSKNARHQYACAAALCDTFSVDDVIVYDPACGTEDVAVAKSWGWRTGTSELDFILGGGGADDGGVVLLFMPHCHSVLYERVFGYVRDNKGLGRVVLLGNVLQPVSSFVEAECSEWYCALLRSTSTCTRRCGSASDSTLESAFNDMAVTTFSENELKGFT